VCEVIHGCDEAVVGEQEATSQECEDGIGTEVLYGV
jgi:hypothetical protein